MWNILNKKQYKMYQNSLIDLTVFVYEGAEKSKLFINYKGYNVLSTMLIWEFAEDCTDFNIEIEFQSENKEIPFKTDYLLVNNKDLDKCINQIAFFIIENFKEKEWNERYKI